MEVECGDVPVLFSENTASNAWFYSVTGVYTFYPEMDRVVISSQRDKSGKPGQQFSLKKNPSGEYVDI